MGAGFCGYAAVILVIAAIDVAAGRPSFHTAGQLGAWLFPPGDNALAGWQSALAYNGVHLVGSVIAGVVAAVAILEAERFEGLWYFALMVLIATGVYALGALGALAVELEGVTDWPTVVFGTAAWLAGIGGYLLARHRTLSGELQAELAEDR